MTPKSSLDSEMVKTMLYLERYQPDSLVIIEENLLKAQKNILEFIGTTENQQKIRTFINQEMNFAFDGLDEEVVNDVREMVGTAWDSMGVLMAKGFVTNAVADAFINYKNVDKSVKDKLSSPKNLVQGHTLEEHFKHINATSTRKLQGIILDGFNKKTGVQNIASEIRNSIGAVNRNQVNTLVRTSLLEALEASKNEALESSFSDVIIGWKYSAVMDTRTSKVCFMNNNIRHKTKEEFKVKPKNHYQCRSMFMPITSLSEEYDKMFPDKKIVEWDGKTVNHRDGTKSTKFKVGEIKTVPKNASAETYFKAYDEKYQRDYMGAKRYDLWKSGKMSFDEAFNVSRKKLLPMSDVKAKVLTTPKVAVPDIKFGYDGKFDGYVKDIRDEAKVVIDKLPKPLSIVASKKGAYYPSKQEIQTPNKQSTFIHEYGHFIDSELGARNTKQINFNKYDPRPEISSGYDDKVIKSGLSKAYDDDIKLLGLAKKETKFEVQQKLKDSWYREEKKKVLSYNVAIEEHYERFSDIVDSLTKGAFQKNYYVHGHGVKYYKRSEARHQENFANLFYLWAKGDKIWDETKVLFPNLSREFEMIMEGVVNGKFD